MGLRLLLPDSHGMTPQALLAKLASRHFRRKNGLCMAEGLRCTVTAVTLRPQDVLAIYCTAQFRQSPHWPELEHLAPVKPTVVEEEAFAAVAETETPQGVAAVLRIPDHGQPNALGTPFTLVLDAVADPGNLGTILRTAWAVGLNSCWLVKGCAAPFSPKSVRAGMGAQFALRIHAFPSLEEAAGLARTLGTREVWCTMPATGISLFDADYQIAGATLVIGNEANGISHPEVGRAVTIPMPGHAAESLNAAQAATVFLVESLRTHSS
ncbi:MAG: RNA methyltransferase [Victivallales bacterium]|nr:RNA methyltransferase [Victivallales bacterium]